MKFSQGRTKEKRQKGFILVISKESLVLFVLNSLGFFH
uniref:Uncharacterized protein n=1 Tax=Rhizophora mucronata TaxID=61149 RepID=A0A2P2NL88_RHIMU